MPPWKVHNKITMAAIDSLRKELPTGLSRWFLNGIFEGIVDPDKTPDKEFRVSKRRGKTRIYTAYVAHHYPSRALIEYYFNLSLYYIKRWGYEFEAGFMLGRALHYAQDGAFSKKRYLILDVHDREEEIMNRLVASSQSIGEFCKTVFVGNKRRSSKAEEAICIGLRESTNLLRRFIEEYNKTFDIPKLIRKIKMIRLTKALILIALILSAVMYQLPLMFFLLFPPIACGIILYRPKTYYEAMRAGLMIVRPYGYEPVY